MTTRPTTPSDMVVLPRLTPQDLSTLMLQLHNTAEALIRALSDQHGKRRTPKTSEPVLDVTDLPTEVPPSVIEALHGMCAERAPLVSAMATLRDDSPTEAQRAIEPVLDAHWRGMRLWAQATVERMIESPSERARAQRVLDVIFSEGLGFIAFFGRDEWQESERRLGVLDSEGLGEVIQALGGGDHLKRLRDAHARYGKAFYLTTAAPSASPEPRVRACSDSASNAVREYVASVVGTVRSKKPETGALAARLLAPMSDYGRGQSPKDKPASPVGPQPPTP